MVACESTAYSMWERMAGFIRALDGSAVCPWHGTRVSERFLIGQPAKKQVFANVLQMSYRSTGCRGN